MKAQNTFLLIGYETINHINKVIVLNIPNQTKIEIEAHKENTTGIALIESNLSLLTCSLDGNFTFFNLTYIF